MNAEHMLLGFVLILLAALLLVLMLTPAMRRKNELEIISTREGLLEFLRRAEAATLAELERRRNSPQYPTAEDAEYIVDAEKILALIREGIARWEQ